MKRVVIGSIVAIPLLLAVSFTWQAPPTGPPEGGNQIQIGTDLALGTDETAVRKVLSARYDLRELDSDKHGTANWLVAAKGDPSHVAGVLGFKEGKLVFATKRWLQRDEDRERGVQTARAVYGILTELVSHGEATCIVSSEQRESPDLSAKTATVRCGHKSLEVLLTARPGETETVEINEVLKPN